MLTTAQIKSIIQQINLILNCEISHDAAKAQEIRKIFNSTAYLLPSEVAVITQTDGEGNEIYNSLLRRAIELNLGLVFTTLCSVAGGFDCLRVGYRHNELHSPSALLVLMEGKDSFTTWFGANGFISPKATEDKEPTWLNLLHAQAAIEAQDGVTYFAKSRVTIKF